MITTTTQFVDSQWEDDYRQERGLIAAEREVFEDQIIRDIFKEDYKIEIGNVRKKSKFGPYAKIHVRHHYRWPARFTKSRS